MSEPRDLTAPAPASKAGARIEFKKSNLDKERSKRPHRQKVIWDTKQSGLCVLVSRGPKEARKATVTFRVCFYLKGLPGKPQYVKIGRYPDDQYAYPYKDNKGDNIVISCSDIDAVRRAASDIRNRAATLGIDPRRPVASDVVADVVKEFIEAQKDNRSWKESQRIFDRYVLPEWRNKRMGDIDRDHVTALLDKIERKKIRHKGQHLGTAFTASATLAQISKLFNWHAARSKHFTSPIVKGMKEARSKPEPRERVLDDAELRALWPLLDGVYGAVSKCALLTAQRFHKVSPMRRADLKANLIIPSHEDADGQWVEDQHVADVWDAVRDGDPKNKQASVVPLSAAALVAINSVPLIDADDPADFVFTKDRRKPINSWSKEKARLDARLRNALRKQGLEFKSWQARDLRRTAKTLMKRAGVSRHISERCLAHKIKGVEGTYDRYDYIREKRDAFDRLAALVERVVNPPTGNVVTLRQGRRRASRSAS